MQTVQIYKFSELSERAKNRAYRDYRITQEIFDLGGGNLSYEEYAEHQEIEQDCFDKMGFNITEIEFCYRYFNTLKENQK